VDTVNGKGACLGTWSSGCANNHTAVTVAATPTVTNLAWAFLIGGLPITPADPAELLGVQWQVNCPLTATAGCAVDLTLDDVAFY
jgi:hypothetical protein